MTTHSANYIKGNNARHLWHPMIDPKVSQSDPPLIIARGDGVHVFDIDGRSLLDCTAGLWNVNVGHNRADVKRAIIEQLDQIAYYSSFAGSTNPPSIALSTLLMEMLAPEGMTKVLFSSGGSDANETAFKLARQYWKLEGQPERIKIISLRQGYHGVHFGGMSATGTAAHRRAYEPLVPGFFQVEAPYIYRNPWTSDPVELARLCALDLDREIQHQGADTVAAFIAEPVQGAGGVIVPPDTYWPLVREVCDKHGVLLIADEVVTGFGRTGALFGSRGFGVKPDIMTLAKGINSGYVPLGATVVNARVESAWKKDHTLAGIMHGYTYSGHPLACAAALACQKIVLEEDLTHNAGAMGASLIGKLGRLADKHPSIGEVRGKGLMIAIEFVLDRKSKAPIPPTHPFTRALPRAALANGAFIRFNAGKLIVSPPLIVTENDVTQMAEIIDASIATAAKEAL
jgi:putrescine---pyruvate transaminase